MDALEILRNDHQKIRNLFILIREAESREEKRDIFDKIKDEFDMHSHVEETVLYPELSDYENVKELLEDAYEEHQEITDLLEEIDETDVEDEAMMDDDIEELIDNVEYHVAKEENELFPKVRQVMTPEDLERLAHHISDARNRLAAA
ncbi:MAG: hypothetical protein A2X94_05420 [Bdellovibrionales bacterium GWB1_55_8]|nr:MAG: hypothetical protein A2X94_05420 [Bdellovibrionales bacterium GWB1_55_8]